MKTKVLISTAILASLSFASLLNTTDQVLNKNTALGGNPAVRAITQKATIEAGATALDFFSQAPIGGDTNIASKLGFLSDLSGSYTGKYNAGWYNIALLNNAYTIESMTKKDVNNVGDAAQQEKSWQVYNENSLAASYALPIAKNLVVGAGLAMEKDSLQVQTNPNKASGLKKDDYTIQSNRYNVYSAGAIYTLDSKTKLTAAQKLSSAYGLACEGKTNGSSISRVEYNGIKPAETDLGAVYTLSDKIEVAGSVEMFWNTMYSETLKKSGNETDTDVTKRGYNKYTLAGEYKYTPDTTVQAYYGWANDARQVNGGTYSDTSGAGYNDTYMGVNVSKTYGDMTILGGIARTNSLDLDANFITDETKWYVNGSYAL